MITQYPFIISYFARVYNVVYPFVYFYIKFLQFYIYTVSTN